MNVISVDLPYSVHASKLEEACLQALSDLELRYSSDDKYKQHIMLPQLTPSPEFVERQIVAAVGGVRFAFMIGGITRGEQRSFYLQTYEDSTYNDSKLVEPFLEKFWNYIKES